MVCSRVCKVAQGQAAYGTGTLKVQYIPYNHFVFDVICVWLCHYVEFSCKGVVVYNQVIHLGSNHKPLWRWSRNIPGKLNVDVIAIDVAAPHDGCPWINCVMMTSSKRISLSVTGLLCGKFSGHRWIPHTKASDAKLWCFLWSAPG